MRSGRRISRRRRRSADPRRKAQAHLIDLPIDFASGERVTRGRFIEHFRERRLADLESSLAQVKT
jgi:hypothetical protein